MTVLFNFFQLFKIENASRPDNLTKYILSKVNYSSAYFQQFVLRCFSYFY